MNEKIKKIIDNSGKTRYQLAKETGVPINTIDRWYTNMRVANTSLIKLIIACSADDEELLKNIKKIGS